MRDELVGAVGENSKTVLVDSDHTLNEVNAVRDHTPDEVECSAEKLPLFDLF